MKPHALARRIDAAQGRIPCDVILKNVQFLDVFSCEWRVGDVAWIDGVIVGLEPGLRANQEIDARGKWLVPGFIDAHVHVESSLMDPWNFQEAVLPRGTTTAICDPHEIANVVGARGIEYFLESSTQLALDLRVMVSSCVPATHLETNGGGTLTARDLAPLARHPRALGLAEMMNVPGVLNSDPDILAKLELFSGRPLDGHCPLLSGQALSAYAAAGISSCHESSQLGEAREKLLKGIAVWIREGSVAKDLDALIPLLTLATSTTLGFCTDDRNPLDIAREGHVDHLVRQAIRRGVAPEVAFRAASWSVARHYGLASGVERKGAIAPGYVADLILLDDAKTCALRGVFRQGRYAEDLLRSAIRSEAIVASMRGNSVRATPPAASDLVGPAGRVNVIGVDAGKILTRHEVMDSTSPGVARLSVLERYGHGSKPANAYVHGFGDAFRGAIASSVGHDSHNLIVVGSDEHEMEVALSGLIRMQGGFCVVKGGAVTAELALPVGGLMTDRGVSEVTRALEHLHQASQAAGCALPEPFLQLAFLSLPVIPSLKLTDKGLIDVTRFAPISVRAS